MSLLHLIKDKYRIVSIIGMSKNSGKTVTLNKLIQEAMEEVIPIGMTSIGRDGESIDKVSETEKPRIFAEENTIIATTTALLEMGDASIEILKVTPFTTPLGDVVIGRVKSAGYIEIAGPQTLKDIRYVCDTMLGLGARFVVIDGAIDRKSSAAPAISEATILSTGAILSRDINRVIEETIHTVGLLSLPQVEKRYIEKARALILDNKIAVIDKNGEVEEIPLNTALGKGHKIGQYLGEDSRALIIPGSLVKGTLEDITRSTRAYKNIDIVVGDGTKVFITPKDYLLFKRIGISIKVVFPINLIGITINPYSPSGYFFEPKNFLEKMKEYIKDIPVMDIMLGGE